MDTKISQDDSPEGRPNLRSDDQTLFIYSRHTGVYEPYKRAEQDDYEAPTAKSEPSGRSFAKHWRRYWTVWVPVIINLLTLIVIGFYTYYAKRQACASIKAANAAATSVNLASNAMKLDERAWVTVNEIKPNSTNALDFSVYFKNTGRTPAREFTVRVTGEPIPKGQQVAAEGDTLPGVAVIAPDGIFRSDLGSTGSYDQRTTDLTIHGRVDYVDIFGKPHWTRFCFYWIPKGKSDGGFAPCNFGNKTDDPAIAASPK